MLGALTNARRRARLNHEAAAAAPKGVNSNITP
jgi:hypothetical protein